MNTSLRLALAFSLFASPAFAQLRPGAFTTVNTTDTTAASVCVGCPVGSTTAGGGLKATTIAGSGNATIGGTLGVTGVLTAPMAVLSQPTITSAVFAGTATGTYTFAGIGTFTGPNVSSPTLSGTVIGTYTLGGTPTIPASGLTGTITSATQDLITRLGTIVSGVWNSTKVGLLYGGTNADLTSTGGTNQLLKQSTLGGAITVGTIATANLSDTANIPLLNAANAFTGSSTYVASSSGAYNPLDVTQNNNTIASSAGSSLTASSTSVTFTAYPSSFATSGSQVASSLRINNTAAGGIGISSGGGAGPIIFYTTNGGGTGGRSGQMHVSGGFSWGSVVDPGAGNVGVSSVFQDVTAGVSTVTATSTTSMAIDKGGTLGFLGSFTGTTPTIFSAIAGLKENSTDSNTAGYLAFYTRAAAGVPAKNMSLSSTGVLTITNLSSGALTSVAGVVTSSSDERLKDISGPLNYGLAEVIHLEPIRYHWNAASGIPTNIEQGGFGAKQVEQWMPLAVGYGKDGYRSLSDRPIIAALVNAVKELNERLKVVEVDGRR